MEKEIIVARYYPLGVSGTRENMIEVDLRHREVRYMHTMWYWYEKDNYEIKASLHVKYSEPIYTEYLGNDQGEILKGLWEEQDRQIRETLFKPFIDTIIERFKLLASGKALPHEYRDLVLMETLYKIYQDNIPDITQEDIEDGTVILRFDNSYVVFQLEVYKLTYVDEGDGWIEKLEDRVA